MRARFLPLPSLVSLLDDPILAPSMTIRKDEFLRSPGRRGWSLEELLWSPRPLEDSEFYEIRPVCGQRTGIPGSRSESPLGLDSARSPHLRQVAVIEAQVLLDLLQVLRQRAEVRARRASGSGHRYPLSVVGDGVDLITGLRDGGLQIRQPALQLLLGLLNAIQLGLEGVELGEGLLVAPGCGEPLGIHLAQVTLSSRKLLLDFVESIGRRRRIRLNATETLLDLAQAAGCPRSRARVVGFLRIAFSWIEVIVGAPGLLAGLTDFGFNSVPEAAYLRQSGAGLTQLRRVPVMPRHYSSTIYSLNCNKTKLKKP